MTTGRIETYFQILGLESNATKEEIMRAYREKAKQLHPDRNPSPDAHEQFILLVEAYNFLSDPKPKKVGREMENEAPVENKWEFREHARKQAQEYANMRYEEFKKTNHYRNTQAVKTVFEHLYALVLVTMFLSPLWGYLYNGRIGLLVGVVVMFVTSPVWVDLFREKNVINLLTFAQSILIVFKTRVFRYFVVLCIHLFLLFRFTLNNQLSIFSFIFILVFLYGLSIAFFQFKLPGASKISKIRLNLFIIPTIFNLFFIANFAFSSHPSKEVYAFEHKVSKYGTGRGYILNPKPVFEKSSHIYLENDAYQDYLWFRIFFDYPSMEYKREITYTFEEGLFGIRVLKEYEFTK